MSQTIDDLLAAVAARGLRLANLFQLESGRWQSNLTDKAGKYLWEFGRGATPHEALRAALFQAANSEPAFGGPDRPGMVDPPKVVNSPEDLGL